MRLHVTFIVAALVGLHASLLHAAGTPFIDGYAGRVSYAPGERAGFHVSTNAPTFELEIQRLGADAEVHYRSDKLPGKQHPVPADASSHGCRWPAAVTRTIPGDWKSGYYVGRLRAYGAPGENNGKPVAESELCFVVRPARPGKDAKILLQLSTNTYNAYSNWGGYSLYAYNGKDNVQGRRVSFERPLTSQFWNWEQPFVQWAERAGYKIDYAANSDLEFHPELLERGEDGSGYRLVLSVGHDEYWSAPMRDNLERFIDRGGNVAFFSGNTCCWQVRSEDGGRALVCWKQAFKDDPLFGKNNALLSTLWSHHLVNRPENQLTGVGFLFGGYHKSHGQFMDGPGAFDVHRPDHWVFAGTDLKRGDAFGGKDTIVGYECDGCEFTKGDDGLPVPTGRDGTPKDFVILATCPARWHPDDSEWYERWEKGRTGAAVMGVYNKGEAGGTVFTAGTTDWSHGLKGNDPAVVRITRNVLDRLTESGSK